MTPGEREREGRSQLFEDVKAAERIGKSLAMPGLSWEENALRELREEMGLEARIVGVLGDYEGTTGVTRFYVGEVTGGDPSAHGEETEEVRLISREEARALLNVGRDRRVLDDLYRWRPPAP